jgi:predicted NUDIX family NTP pyrophosphohydrolase
MPKQSAGVLLYKLTDGSLHIFLVHPGGPFFRKKDDGVWSIPKGEFVDGEEPLAAAQREFEEEIGRPASGNFIKLKPIKQKSGKLIHAWAVEGDMDNEDIKSNLFEIEWPPRSGKIATFPEVDRAGWFTADVAMQKIIPGQAAFITELENLV